MEPDQTARRHQVVDANTAAAVVHRLGDAPTSQGEQLRDDAEVLLRDVHAQRLDGLVQATVDLARDHLGPPDGELEALAAERLDEDRELQLAASLHDPRVGAVGVPYPQRHVADQLGVEAVLEHARRELRPVAPCQGRGVRADEHRQARLINRDERERLRAFEVGQRLTDGDLLDARDRRDLARPRLVRLDALKALGNVEPTDRGALDRTVATAPRDLLAATQGALHHAAQGEPSHVRRRIEVRDERLQRVAGLVRRRRDVRKHEVHERTQIRASYVRVQRGRPVARDAVDDREVNLRLGRVEVEEQLVDLVDHLGDAGVGAVDLVDDEDDGQVAFERLAEHEARLRQRPLARVDEEQRTVGHRQAALHLAAEVRVAGRVNDVDLHVAHAHGGVLREDRDAFLTLQLVRVHDALGRVGVRAELARLLEQSVDQRRLAVVDVRDDRDVADVVAGGDHARIRCLEGH